MKTIGARRFSKAIITATIFVTAFFFASLSYAEGNVDYSVANTREDRNFFELLDDFQNGSASPLEEVPKDHWAYKAIDELASIGLLDGYEGGKYKDGQVLTRYEMAAIVTKILDNYLEWTKTGKVTEIRKIMIELPAEPVKQASPPREPAPEITQEIPAPVIKIAPLIPATPKAKDITVTSENGMKVTLTRTTKMMNAGEEAQAPANLPPIDTIPGSGVPKAKPPQPVAEKPVAPPAEPAAPRLEERIEKVEKAVDLSQKDIDTIEKLVNTFKKEIKDLNTSISKNIKDVERTSLKNKRDIDNLKQEFDKLKIGGSNQFSWETGGPVTGDGSSGTQTTSMNDSFALKFTSKPVSSEDLTLTTSMGAYSQMGGRGGFKGLISGEKSAFMINDLTVQYNNLTVDPKHPKNFKLRTLAVGDTGVMFSPLTVFGRKIQGINMGIGLNKYTVNVFGSRVAIHPVKPFFLPGDVDIYYDNTQYDRYLYGISLNSSVFGEAKSMGYLSKIWMQDNQNTNYPGCRLGYWVDLNLSTDPFAYKDPNTDLSYQKFFCGPPEKNSVTSAFVRYPLPFMKNLFVTAEYAHSTYFKPGYRAVKSEEYLFPDSVPSDSDLKQSYCIDAGIDPSSANCASIVQRKKDEYEAKKCDTTDMNNSVYASGNKACWMQVKERNDQDDAFILLFDFNKGPIKIFPLGYVRLGPEFVTKYFGLPGFDLSSAGLDMSVLPISIQSLEAYVANFTIDQLQEKKYSYTTYYVVMNEIKPMYFDPGALAVGMSNNKSKGTVLDLLPKILARINNRTETLRINVWNNSLKYNITDNINFELGTTKVKAVLPPTCLDGEITPIKNDKGETIDYEVGNGSAVCTPDNLDDNPFALDVNFDKQSYKLFWRASKKGTFETNFGINGTKIVFYYPNVTAVEPLIRDLIAQGKYYTLDNRINYKLTSSTDISLSFNKKYDRMPASDDTGKYPVIDSETLSFRLSTNF